MRNHYFLQSFLWVNDGHKDCILPALQRSLKNLQLDYIDLYLLHWPVCIPPGELRLPGPKEKILPIDYASKLELILASAKIPPAVNQVEVNPLWRQEKLIRFCKDKGIAVTALLSFGHCWIGLYGQQ
ncbi:Nadph-dependent codeinone reductase 1-2 [Thalictrum thalictroides]|uniref:Nadph-dependent codeinone reductase 1-2 n=1 Tax=Thalictrum thalictroides TaxID=46969 RepID=A0A7J6USV5_THATH|nr:Nadph-dependent codeinone reductase 1-2 [Thalictrum thalictroides]